MKGKTKSYKWSRSHDQDGQQMVKPKSRLCNVGNELDNWDLAVV